MAAVAFGRTSVLPMAAGAVLVATAAAFGPLPGILAACVVLFCAAALAEPSLALVAVAPAAYLTQRVGGDLLSLADFVLVLGIAVCLLHLPRWWSRALVAPLVLVTLYQGVLLIPVLWHPTPDAVFEWAHRAAFMGGGVLIGAGLVAERRESAAIKAYLLVSAVVAAVAIFEAVTSGFAPVYPLGIAKNLAGGLIVVAFLVSLATLRENIPNTLFTAVLALGVVSTQSRAAMVVAAAGVAFVVLRERRLRPSTAMFGVGVALMSVYAVLSLVSGSAATNPQGSVETRVQFREQAMEYWRETPLLGQGIRYYTDVDRFVFPKAEDASAPGGGIRHPHNVVVETLSESGVVGMLGLVGLLGGALFLVRGRSPLEIAAAAAMAGTAVLGLFDLYWLAGRTTVPWILLGLAVGAGATRRSITRPPAPA